MKSLQWIFSMVMIAALVLGLTANASLAAPTISDGQTVAMGGKDFAQCFIEDMKMLPEVKKLTPKQYQKFEQSLNNLFQTSRFVNAANPYFAAVMAGAKIGKFIGYDFVFILGAVQDCWPQLKN
jgi:hypothetical protein